MGLPRLQSKATVTGLEAFICQLLGQNISCAPLCLGDILFLTSTAFQFLVCLNLLFMHIMIFIFSIIVCSQHLVNFLPWSKVTQAHTYVYAFFFSPSPPSCSIASD